MYRLSSRFLLAWIGGLGALVLLGIVAFRSFMSTRKAEEPKPIVYRPREEFESSGAFAVMQSMGLNPWSRDSSFPEYAETYLKSVDRGLADMDWHLEHSAFRPQTLIEKASLYHARGDTAAAYKLLEETQTRFAGTELEGKWLYSLIFYKGLTALRRGENENCILCRGESSCIFPINPAAVHTNPAGSRLAIKHFTEYLTQFPDDLEVKWLLNLAHMTLGEHPDKVDPRHLLPLELCSKSEFDIGQFRDVGHLVGINRLNQSGGAILDDFDNDGLLDFVVTCWAPSEPMAYYHNQGDGKFEDRTKSAGIDNQLGGLFCVQTDYNNDGHLDIFIPRGSWLSAELSQHPSLLRNNRDGTFTDVTREAGLEEPTNSTSAAWADYDNDGDLDLFLCCQKQKSLLYRNRGDGQFEKKAIGITNCLGATWVDVDNDGYPELFVNISTGRAGSSGTGVARLYRNKRDGSFTDFSEEMGIDGPNSGFSCWAFDFDNDGWLDIFATSSSHTLAEVVQGLLEMPCDQKNRSKLYRNTGGRFEDVTREAGLDKVYSPMGSNFGDLDNDGYLDFYLGTGDPGIGMLIPNRLFKNVGGKRFAEITGSSRMGHLQKGHAVAFGDWDRNGAEDVFIELGGAIHGDRYHNVLFQNPGHGNSWLSVKLIGVKTNKAAIGARIKVVTAGEQPQTIHRHVSSGSSFGANPLEQHFGLGKAERVARVEIFWPTSNETQVFEDIAVNQGLVITEFEKDFQQLQWRPIPLPK